MKRCIIGLSFVSSPGLAQTLALAKHGCLKLWAAKTGGWSSKRARECQLVSRVDHLSAELPWAAGPGTLTRESLPAVMAPCWSPETSGISSMLHPLARERGYLTSCPAGHLGLLGRGSVPPEEARGARSCHRLLFLSAATLLGCSCPPSLGGFHLVLGIQVAVPMTAPSFWLGQNDHHDRPGEISCPQPGAVGPPGEGCHRAGGPLVAARGFLFSLPKSLLLGRDFTHPRFVVAQEAP